MSENKKNNTLCPYCQAIFSHQPENSHTVMWKCGSWENRIKYAPRIVGKQTSYCRIRQLEAKIKELEQKINE